MMDLKFVYRSLKLSIEGNEDRSAQVGPLTLQPCHLFIILDGCILERLRLDCSPVKFIEPGCFWSASAMPARVYVVLNALAGSRI